MALRSGCGLFAGASTNDPPARRTLRSSRPGGRFLLERVVLSRGRRGLPPGRRATAANQWVIGCSMQGLVPFHFAIDAAYFPIAAVGGRSSSPLAPLTGASASPLPPRVANRPMMRRAESHTASVTPIISCLPVSTSASRHSISAVTPGPTSPGAARSRTPNRASPRSVGTMFLPCAAIRARWRPSGR